VRRKSSPDHLLTGPVIGGYYPQGNGSAGLNAPGGLHVLRWVEGIAVQRTGAPMQAPLRLRQTLPFRVFLSGLFLQRCR